MTDEPTMLLLLLGSGLLFVFVVLLWKLLLLTGGIAAAQWAMVTGFADHPAVQAAAYALPALLAACALLYLPRHAGLSARGLRIPSNPRRRARGHRLEVVR